MISLLGSVDGLKNQWIASGADLSAPISVLEALDRRADEIKAEAEAGYLAKWKALMAAYDQVK